MNLNSILTLDNLQSLDLHGLDRDYSTMLINQFIDDMRKMKIENFVIVHGVGAKVLLKTTHDILKKNKHVKDYKLFYNNSGCTVVELNKDW